MSNGILYLSSLALVALVAVLPGLVARRLLRFSFASHLESVVVIPVLGMSISGACVLILLSLNLYVRPIVIVMAGICAVYVVLPQRARSTPQPAPPPVSLLAPLSLSLADVLALLAVGSVVLVALLDASTSPPTWWDGYITWDKWAMDWGRRQSLYGYVPAYPQAFPMFSSLIYKLTATSGEVLPLSTFALHSVHPLLALILVLALMALARLLRTPVWPLVLLMFGMRTFRDQLTSGAADMMVTAFAVVAAAIGLRLVGEESCKRRENRVVLLFLLYGAAAVKTTGLVAVSVVAMGLLLSAGTTRLPGALKHLSRCLLWVLVLPVLLNSFFLLEQSYTARTMRVEQQDPSEVNFSFEHAAYAWKKSREVRQSKSFGFTATVSGILDDYSVPKKLHPLVMTVGAILLVLGLSERTTWPLVAPVILYVFAWARVFSYDLRNLLPVVPFVALWLTLGGAFLWRRVSASRGRMVRFAGALTAATLVIFVFVSNLYPHLSDAWRSLFREGRFSGRMDAMRRGPDERIRVYFPDQYEEYLLLKDSGIAGRAHQILAGCHLYRWFATGRYPLARFTWGELRSGDIFVGNSPAAPPQAEAWLLVRESPRRIYIYRPGLEVIPPAALLLTGVRPPVRSSGATGRDSIVFSGEMSLVALDVLKPAPAPRSHVIWRVECATPEKTLEIVPFFLGYDAAAIDVPASATAVDRSQPGVVKYGGVVTLGEGPLSTRPRDGVLVGIRSDSAGTRCVLGDFAASVFPPATR